jgi:L-aspartate oxidase
VSPTPQIVERLACGPVEFVTTTDVLVVGTGVGGLSLATALSGHGLHIEVVTKEHLGDGSTRWAQGGVATAGGPGDDPEHHLEDTLVAGAGLCDVDAVRILCTEGPAAVDYLMEHGTAFDRGADGALSYTLEGGHSRPRIVHAGGDATGLEIQVSLEESAGQATDLHVVERTFLLDLLRATDGTVVGARVSRWTGERAVIGEIRARATVLATGGFGQVFAKTSNPAVATGDGLAAAIRAGAEVADIEFVQFHPTVLAIPSVSDAAGRAPLVSEAVRGEGAVLIDADGNRVMAGKHPREDLAPRDVVAAAMAARMAELGVDHLYLDARHLGESTLLRRFPTIVASCREAGVDPVTAPIPVAPAAHYACGGVRADMDGRTSLPGLYAVGEVACTGVHGANRLASNSLLEATVVARRLAELLLADLPIRQEPADDARPAGIVDPARRDELTAAMVRYAGVVRDPQELDDLATVLTDILHTRGPEERHAAWVATNLHTIAVALVSAAQARLESRGCHRRSDIDHPVVAMRHRIVTTSHDGALRLVAGPPVTDPAEDSR